MQDQAENFCSVCGMDLTERGTCAGCDKAPEACTCEQAASMPQEEEQE